ncbi:MAG: hypothetical protein WC628_03275 [Candidatus Omnitrophota bacterium]
MPDCAKLKPRGIVLLLVLAAVVLVVILAGAILSLILNQARITNHQVNRIRAYYAAQAGVNLAMEKLRVGDWTNPAVHMLCNATICSCNSPGNVCDEDMPFLVNINITRYGGQFNISATANYTASEI